MGQREEGLWLTIELREVHRSDSGKKRPGSFDSGGAPPRDCINLLDRQGAKPPDNDAGPVVPFKFSRLWGWRYSMAVGTDEPTGFSGAGLPRPRRDPLMKDLIGHDHDQ